MKIPNWIKWFRRKKCLRLRQELTKLEKLLSKENIIIISRRKGYSTSTGNIIMQWTFRKIIITDYLNKWEI